MTLENLLAQVGIGTKLLTDRYSGEYGAPVQDQHIYYSYEPSQSSHGHAATSKHNHYSGGGLKSNASMSALTLLAFLFFLHILQQCIKEHMTEMSNPPVVVMSASREGDDDIAKTASKIDKIMQFADPKKEIINPYKNVEQDKMLRIDAPEHKPKRTDYSAHENDGDGSFPGFVSAMSGD